MRVEMKSVLIALFLSSMLCPWSSFGTEDVSTAHEEITHLLKYIRVSDCKFDRNGSFHSAIDGYDHVLKKYEHFRKKRRIKTAEDFIEYAATKSLMSGKMYHVELADGSRVLLKDWLSEELVRLRKIDKE
jgi:hypothetical protein